MGESSRWESVSPEQNVIWHHTSIPSTELSIHSTKLSICTNWYRIELSASSNCLDTKSDSSIMGEGVYMKCWMKVNTWCHCYVKSLQKVCNLCVVIWDIVWKLSLRPFLLLAVLFHVNPVWIDNWCDCYIKSVKDLDKVVILDIMSNIDWASN